MAAHTQITQKLSINLNSLMKFRLKISSLLMISGSVELTLLQRKSFHLTIITQSIMMKTISCSPKLSRCQQIRHPRVAITGRDRWPNICRQWRMLLIALHPLTISQSLLRHHRCPAKMLSLKERSCQPSINLRSHRPVRVQLTESLLKKEIIVLHQLLRYKSQYLGRSHPSLPLEELRILLSRSNLLNSKLTVQVS
jgi:hypothetical protein